MTLADFVEQILSAQGTGLQNLGILIGYETLGEIIDTAQKKEPPFEVDPEWLNRLTSSKGLPSAHSPYARLDDVVRELKLPTQLEFALWSFPPYRTIVECGASWESPLNALEDSTRMMWVEAIVRYSKLWFESLDLPSEIRPKALKLSEIPWIRFRSELLKRLGKRPLQSI